MLIIIIRIDLLDLRRGPAGAILRGISPARRRAEKTVQVETLCQSF